MTIQDAALSYASRGWPVIPIAWRVMDGLPDRDAGKAPLTEHGHKDGSTEHSQIYLWWQQWPEANVAIVTGLRSGLIVLDVDYKNDGFASLAMLERNNGPLPKTVTARSGGGGKHFYFRHPLLRGVGAIAGRRGMRHGLDVRAERGAIVAPPSRHQSGNIYAWEDGLAPEETTLAPLPSWLLTIIQTKNKPQNRRRKKYSWADILSRG